MKQSLNRAGQPRRTMLQIAGFNFYDVFVYAFCIIFALICVYPMWYVLICSITPYEEYIKGGLMLWPTGGVDLQYYQAIFSTKAFTTSMWISVSKTAIATVLSLLVTATMAYACSKTHVRGMKVVNALVVFNLFFTGGLIPQYMLYRDLNLLGSYWVMVIPGALNITYFIIMRNYFTYSVPKELEEAALIDGCTDVGVFFRIVTPVSRSMLAAVALFIAVINWNDYYNYMMFISNKTNLQPFVWILRRMLVDQSMMNTVRRGAVGLGMELPPPMALRMATIICAMVPIMCVYPFLQKYFTSGITLGAIKE
ncbi:MAG TPA: carbohydrate ABC transporter permease [Candidatus Aphodomorpha intestinavium]|uniref:Carbohydrate ABC transporter permease n=1 Tax=Candidatus Aphodomorpha intestinavium TaxID=2840672 RepID=A0A9D1STW0_9FIRM|nr:carbohydrate ABC transporter permease [Candidatus Aphodomorpha intestinavium]